MYDSGRPALQIIILRQQYSHHNFFLVFGLRVGIKGGVGNEEMGNVGNEEMGNGD